MNKEAVSSSKSEYFVAVHKCKTCDVKLDDHTRTHRDGVCPYCGAISEGTVIDTYKDTEARPYPSAWVQLIPYAIMILLAGALFFALA